MPRRRVAVVVGTAVAGLLLAAVGIGIAPVHLAKTGLSVVALLGAAALVGGLIAYGGSVRRLLAPAPRAAGIGGWFAALVALVLAAEVVGVAVAVVTVPDTSSHGRTPALADLRYDDVVLRTADGVRLAGWYVPSRNGAAVVVRHGSGSTRADVLPQAAVLARHGYGVLLVDARGHGDSGGRAMDLGWFGDDDLRPAVSFLASRLDVDGDRIGVLGLSMGGEEAIGASATDGRIRAVVAEGATGRSARDKSWFSERYGVRGVVQEWIEGLQTSLVDVLTSASPPTSLRDAVRSASAPPTFLIAAGTVADEGEVAKRLAAAGRDVTTWVVPGAGHTGGLRTDPDGWESRVVGFLDRALAAA